MQRLIKFATSPSTNRHSRATTAKSVDLDIDAKLDPDPTRPASECPPAQATPTVTPRRQMRKLILFNIHTNHYSMDDHRPLQNNHHKPSDSKSVSPRTTRRPAVHLPISPIRAEVKTGRQGVLSPSRKTLAADFGDLEYMNTSNEGYRLSAEQKELLRQAWRSCNQKGGCAAGVWIFKRLFANYPYLKHVFNMHEIEGEQELEKDANFQRHAKRFTDVLEMILDSIDALDDSMGPLLISYGAKHVHFEKHHDFQPEYWDAFAVAMSEYATNNWKFFKNGQRRAEALRAWRVLIFFVVSKVKQGYVLEKQAEQQKNNYSL